MIEKIDSIVFLDFNVNVYYSEYGNNSIMWCTSNPKSYYTGYLPKEDGSIIPEQSCEDKLIIPGNIILNKREIDDDLKSEILSKIENGFKERNGSNYTKYIREFRMKKLYNENHFE